MLVGTAQMAKADLVLEYLFETTDTATFSTAIDTSGNGYDATIDGGAVFTAGVIGQALNMDGEGNSITLPPEIWSTISTEFSLSTWLYGGPSNPERSAFLYGTDIDGNREVQLHIPWENARVYFDGPQRVNTGTQDEGLLKGAWNHWVFTKNADNGTMSIYVNNTQVATRSDRFDPLAVVEATLGNDPYADPPRFYEGQVDEFRIYNHELSEAEIADLYMAVPEPSSAALIIAGLFAFFGYRRR